MSKTREQELISILEFILTQLVDLHARKNWQAWQEFLKTLGMPR